MPFLNDKQIVFNKYTRRKLQHIYVTYKVKIVFDLSGVLVCINQTLEGNKIVLIHNLKQSKLLLKERRQDQNLVKHLLLKGNIALATLTLRWDKNGLKTEVEGKGYRDESKINWSQLPRKNQIKYKDRLQRKIVK